MKRSRRHMTKSNRVSNSIRPMAAFGGSLCLLSTAATPVWAQQAPLAAASGTSTTEQSGLSANKAAGDELAEIVVTARDKRESLQDVPLSIGAVSGSLMNEEHIEDLKSVAQLVPNFDPTIITPRVAGLAIRGIGAGILNGNGDGAQSGVGYIVDNVFYTYVGFSWPNLVDLENIEVARGPQGTLLGKNTTVGAVIVNTQLPSFTPSSTLEATYGNYNRGAVRVNATGPLIDGEVAGRMTFFGDWGNGFYPNTGPGTVNEQFLNQNRYGLRGQLLFTPSDSITDRVVVNYAHSAELDTYFAIYADSFPFYANGKPHATYGQRLLSLFGVKLSTNPYVANIPVVPQNGVQTHDYGISNELNWSFGPATLTSITAYAFDQVFPHNGLGDNGLQAQSNNTFDVNVRQYSQETRLSSPAGGKVDWQVGNYLLRENLSSVSINAFGNQSAVFYLNNPAANNAILNGVVWQYAGEAITSSAALFGQITWHATDKLNLTAGVRDTFEHVEGSDRGSFAGGAQNLDAADEASRLSLMSARGFNATGQGFGLSQVKSNNSVSFLLNPSYKLTDNVLLYGSYARGAKSGAVDTTALPIYASNHTTIIGNYPVITRPETSDDYELGIKTNWLDNHVTANLNLYDDTIHDYQAPITDLSYTDPVTHQPLSVSYLGNVPEIRLTGVEFESRWQITRDFSAFLNGAYTSDKYISYPNAAPPADQQYAGAPKVLSLSGTKLLNVAPYSYNLGVNYEHPIGDRVFFAYGVDSWSDTVTFSNPYSIYRLTQPQYSLVNAGLGFHSADSRYSVEVWSKNLLNVRYVFGQMTIGSTTAPSAEWLGNPRTYGVTVKIKL